MNRRELLRLLLVTGLAGCTTGPDPVVTAATPTPAPRPTAPASDPGRAAAPAVPTRSEQAATARSDEVTDAPTPRAGEPAAEAEEPTLATDGPAPTPEEPTEPPEPDEPDEPENGTAPGDEPATASGDPRVVTAVGRGALGLPAARTGGRRHTITGLMVHHTAGPTGDASGAPDRFRGITRGHRDQGWVDVAYHWGVDADGTVYELRDEAIAGDTNTDYDPAGWFLVVCDGDFESATPPPAMLDALADVLAHGARRHGVDPATLRGHRDLAATLCPGANLQARVAELAAEVRRRLDAGGVVLRPSG